MRKINETTRQRISDTIAAVERNCDSELVCLITPRSARYVMFPLIMAALLALFLPTFQILIPAVLGVELIVTYPIQILVFVCLAVLFTQSPLRLILTPTWLKWQNCQRYSAEQFFQNRLHDTSSRNAILIFVSWDEHFVTVVGDKGINAKVAQSDWDGLVTTFTAEMKDGRIEDGFVKIVEGAGQLLAQHFPNDAPKDDVLSNHLLTPKAPTYLS